MQAQGGAAEREQPALHLHLGKAGIAGAQVDVGCEHQLDAHGEAVSLRRDDHRFADYRPPGHPPGIAAAGRYLPTLAQTRAHRRQIQPRGEMLTVAIHQRHPRHRLALERAVGQAQGIEHGQVERIAFGRAVKADEHDVLAQLAADLAGAGGGHDGVLRRFWMKGFSRRTCAGAFAKIDRDADSRKARVALPCMRHQGTKKSHLAAVFRYSARRSLTRPRLGSAIPRRQLRLHVRSADSP